MPSIPALQGALSGIRENLRVFDETALRLSRTLPAGNLADDLVQLSVAEYGARANAKVIQTSDGLTGTLLDIFG